MWPISACFRDHFIIPYFRLTDCIFCLLFFFKSYDLHFFASHDNSEWTSSSPLDSFVLFQMEFLHWNLMTWKMLHLLLFNKMLSPSYIFNMVTAISYHKINKCEWLQEIWHIRTKVKHVAQNGFEMDPPQKIAVWWAFSKAEHQTPWSSLWSADISGQVFCSHLGTTYKKTRLGF